MIPPPTTTTLARSGRAAVVLAEGAVSVVSPGGDVTLRNNSRIISNYIAQPGAPDAISVVALNLNLSGYSYVQSSDATSNINVLVEGDITVSNSGIRSGNDIFLTLNGGDSQVNLDGGYIWSDTANAIASTTTINFLARSSGGVTIDGVDTTA